MHNITKNLNYLLGERKRKQQVVVKKQAPSLKPIVEVVNSDVVEWKDAIDSLEMILEDESIYDDADVKEWKEAIETMKMLIDSEI